MAEDFICKICNEHIDNFFCIKCLSKNIMKRLPPEASLEFSKFHNIFYSSFYNEIPGRTIEFKCKKCNTPDEYPVCQYCYIREAIEWLKVNNHGAAEKLRKMFSIASPLTVNY